MPKAVSDQRRARPLRRRLTGAAPPVIALLLCLPAMSPHAQGVSPTPQPDARPIPPEQADQVITEPWAIHGQTTGTVQYQPAFHSPYQGPQSLSPAANARETLDATLYLGLRPWAGAEIWVNPEIDQGFGIQNTFGAAGYVSGEAYKTGARDPYYIT